MDERRDRLVLALMRDGLSRWTAEALLSDYDAGVLAAHVGDLVIENSELRNRLATTKAVAS